MTKLLTSNFTSNLMRNNKEHIYPRKSIYLQDISKIEKNRVKFSHFQEKRDHYCSYNIQLHIRIRRNITTMPATPRKAVRTLAMLILWEIWKERNSRVFQRQESSVLSLFAKIKNEATAWAQAGASRFASLLMRE